MDIIQLHTAQEYADGLILEHVNELIDSLEAKGINSTPEDEQDDGGWKMWMRTAGTETVTETSRCPKLVPELRTDVEIIKLRVSDIGRRIQRCDSNLHSDLLQGFIYV